MSDIKLFQIGGGTARELPAQGAQIEKSLQIMFERNLESLLGIRFLASEYSTGPVHGGRIDTLGLDEDGRPVIIEYKRALNESETKEARRSDLIAYRLQNVSPELRDVWDAVRAYLLALGDDVQENELKFYHAFRRLKNFVCLEAYPVAQTVLAHLKLDPSTVVLEEGFTRDMRTTAHFGTGNLQVILRSIDDVNKALPLFQRAYDGN